MSSEAEQAEEAEGIDEGVGDDLDKKTMGRRKIRHGNNKKGAKNLSEGRLKKQSKHTTERPMKTSGKL